MERKYIKNARELQARIDEMHTKKVFLNNNRNELNALRAKLADGDTTVVPRIRELFDIIDEEKAWIDTNEKIIKDLLR